MEKNIPPSLIKYYACNKFSCEAFLNSYLWASYPLQFNDPFDCSERFWELESFSYDSILNEVPEKFHDVFKKDDDNFQRRRKFIELFSPGIVCLNKPNRKNEDILWGYYTNQEGFSVEFDSTTLSQDWGSSKIVEVDYVDDPKEVPKCSLQNHNDGLINWISKKKRIWNGEEEWRFIFHFDECNGYNPIFNIGEKRFRQKSYSQNAIKKLVLGYKFFIEQINTSRKIEITSKIDAFIIKPEDNQFKWFILANAYEKGIELYQTEISENFGMFKRKIEILDITKTKVLIYKSDIIKK